MGCSSLNIKLLINLLRLGIVRTLLEFLLEFLLEITGFPPNYSLPL